VERLGSERAAAGTSLLFVAGFTVVFMLMEPAPAASALLLRTA